MPRRFFQISIRGIFLMTTIIALGVVLALNWTQYGVLFCPVILLASIAGAMVCLFFRRHLIARIGFRTGVTIAGALILFYLSFGPACWIMASVNTPGSNYPRASSIFTYVYRPVAANVIFAPEPIRAYSMSYISWWMPPKALSLIHI